MAHRKEPPISLKVFVPARDSALRASLAPGCAMVGSDQTGGVFYRAAQEPGLVIIDLEDNRYGRVSPADDLEVYMDCLKRAAGRHWQRYPTVARIVVNAGDVHQVGTFEVLGDGQMEPASHLTLTDSGELEAWREEGQ